MLSKRTVTWCVYNVFTGCLIKSADSGGNVVQIDQPLETTEPSTAGLPQSETIGQPACNAGPPQSETAGQPSSAGPPQSQTAEKPSNAGLPQSETAEPSNAVPPQSETARPSAAGLPQFEITGPSAVGLPQFGTTGGLQQFGTKLVKICIYIIFM